MGRDARSQHTGPESILETGKRSGSVVITGGSGFIGSNVAERELEQGNSVRLLDNLSRPGVRQNFDVLRATFGDRVQLQIADIRDAAAVHDALSDASRVYHFAAQAAVTTSLSDPVEDFEINARGTLNVLEALRSLKNPPPLLFTSTNKVYGNLADLSLRRSGERYEPSDPKIRVRGVGEDRPLEFHSPYGCSKGTADQYVLDYARIYGLKTVVFRMSCIYGPRQFGTEDQGWVAHFMIRALEDLPITLYGDGMQVRDILFVEDLVDAMQLALGHIDTLSGTAFNMGGGPGNTISLLELLTLIGELRGTSPAIRFDGWRAGDQRYYVSDISRFREATGWSPRVRAPEGIERLLEWLVTDRQSRGLHVPSGIHHCVAMSRGSVSPRKAGLPRPSAIDSPGSGESVSLQTASK